MIDRQWRRQELITLILVCLALIAITGIDLFLFPHQNVTVLYMIPVLIAALRTSPRVVGGIAATTLVVDFINATNRHDLTHTWPIRTIALLVAYAFAVLLASQRQELARRSNEIEVARARLQSILENAPDAILYIEAESNHLVANPRAVQLFGTGVERAPGTRQYMRQLRTTRGEQLGGAQWPSERALH
ncbi:MAG TPA: PAS domain-containing protein, partial [Chloroflexota bacterium]|nr:PAS domain-containing protein [Chloroflexota bacterium]